jgi:hypothetical protein
MAIGQTLYIDQVSDLPPFGARLARLLEHRATSAIVLAETAGVPAAQLDAVLAGGEPDDSLPECGPVLRPSGRG